MISCCHETDRGVHRELFQNPYSLVSYMRPIFLQLFTEWFHMPSVFVFLWACFLWQTFDSIVITSHSEEPVSYAKSADAFSLNNLIDWKSLIRFNSFTWSINNQRLLKLTKEENIQRLKSALNGQDHCICYQLRRQLRHFVEHTDKNSFFLGHASLVLIALMAYILLKSTIL